MNIMIFCNQKLIKFCLVFNKKIIINGYCVLNAIYQVNLVSLEHHQYDKKKKKVELSQLVCYMAMGWLLTLMTNKLFVSSCGRNIQ